VDNTELTDRLLGSYESVGGINHLDGKNLPSRHAVGRITSDLLRLLFPGFFDETAIATAAIRPVTSELLDEVASRLAREIGRSLEYARPPELPDKDLGVAARRLALEFLASLPRVRELLATDVEAAYNGDPAALSKDEVIVAYPFVEAIEIARRLGREEGILSGISSGAATSVALRLAKLDEFAGKTIVVVLPDSGERYISTVLFEGIG